MTAASSKHDPRLPVSWSGGDSDDKQTSGRVEECDFFLIASSRVRLPPVNLPTVAEAGVKGYEFVGWYGLVTRAGTPPAIVDKVHADTAAVLGNEEIKSFLANEGLTAAVNTPAQFATYINEEMKKSARLVKDAGLDKR